jgi:hypothetical protein
VELAGGLGSGIRVGCELRKIWPKGETHDAVRLRIKATRDIDNSTAELIGDTDLSQIHAHDSFQIYSWPAGANPILTMYLPAKSPPQAVVLKLAQDAKAAVSAAGAIWAEDTATKLPDWTIRWNGSTWEIWGKSLGPDPVNLGATVSVTGLKQVSRQGTGQPILF